MSVIAPEFEMIDRSTRSIRYIEHKWPNDFCRTHAHAEYEFLTNTILQMAGIKNLVIFNRHFLKVKGATPSEYRDIARNDMAPQLENTP